MGDFMSREKTLLFLDKIRDYIDIENVELKEETFRGSKYIEVQLTPNGEISFHVYDNEIIVFYFSAHSHFDNYWYGDNRYIDEAVDFLIYLFNEPFKLVEFFKGENNIGVKQYVLEDGEEICVSEILYTRHSLKNIFKKRRCEIKIIKYDKEIKNFITYSDYPGFSMKA